MIKIGCVQQINKQKNKLPNSKVINQPQEIQIVYVKNSKREKLRDCSPI